MGVRILPGENGLAANGRVVTSQRNSSPRACVEGFLPYTCKGTVARTPIRAVHRTGRLGPLKQRFGVIPDSHIWVVKCGCNTLVQSLNTRPTVSVRSRRGKSA